MKKKQSLLLAAIMTLVLSITIFSAESVYGDYEPHSWGWWWECHHHASGLHAYSIFYDGPYAIICAEEFYAWATPLWDAKTPDSEECTVNLYTVINHFDISYEVFQELIDKTQVGRNTHFNLEILFSGDRALIDAYYSSANGTLHNHMVRERQRRQYLEEIAEMQIIVNANTSVMSRYFHDILTWANQFGVSPQLISGWMSRHIAAGAYERVNIAELASQSWVHRDAIEYLMPRRNVYIFAHYNLDIIFSNDWDLILSYYAIENEPLHTAQVQAAFDRHVATYGMPDISWQLNAAQTAPTLRVRIDGQFVHIPANEQQPLIENGRTLVPFRIVMEALGFTVSWDGQTRTASLAKTGYEISVQLGSTFMLVNGNPVSLDVPAQSMNGRTMVPLRALSEATGMQVRWDGGNFIVEISTR